MTLGARSVGARRRGRVLRGARRRHPVAGAVADGASADREGAGCGLGPWLELCRRRSSSRRSRLQRERRAAAGSLTRRARCVSCRRARLVRAAGRRPAARPRTGARSSTRAPRISATSRCCGTFTAPGMCWTRCTTRSSRRGPRGRLRPCVLVCASLGPWWLCRRAPARVDRAGGGVRSVPRLRPALSGDGHEPLRAAARGADGVSRRGGAAPAARTTPAWRWRWRLRCSTRTSAAPRSPPSRARRRPRSGCSTTWATRRGRRPSRRCWRWIGGRISTFAGRSSGWAMRCRAIARKLPAPPQHEWLEAVKYWNGGGRAPVWFVVDPMRTSIDLVQHGEPSRYRWPLPYPVLVGGARPNEMDWYRVDRPEWYVGEGWALTPEAAGVSERDGTGLAHAPIKAWASRSTLGGVLMIGGRNFEPAARTTFTVAFDGVTRDHVEPLPPGPFLRFVDVPAAGVPGDVERLFSGGGDGDAARPGRRRAVRRVVGAAGRRLRRRMARAGAQPAHRPALAMAERARRAAAAHADGRALTLHLEGESPLTVLFARLPPGRAIGRSRRLRQDAVGGILAGHSDRGRERETISLETDQVFAPADRSRRSADRRHLGLRIFKCELRPARSRDCIPTNGRPLSAFPVGCDALQVVSWRGRSKDGPVPDRSQRSVCAPGRAASCRTGRRTSAARGFRAAARPVMIVLIGAGGTRISSCASSSFRSPRRRCNRRDTASGANSVALV